MPTETSAEGVRSLIKPSRASVSGIRQLNILDPNGIAFVVLFPFSAVYLFVVWAIRKRRELRRA